MRNPIVTLEYPKFTYLDPAGDEADDDDVAPVGSTLLSDKLEAELDGAGLTSIRKIPQ